MNPKKASSKMNHPGRHSMKRRSRRNDYRGKRIYMITMTKHPEAPWFGNLTGNPHIAPGQPGAPGIELLPFGKKIDMAILKIWAIDSSIETISRIVMPDHIHFIVFVKEPIERHVGKIFGIFKHNITKTMWKLFQELGEKRISCFEENYNDRILLKRGQLETMKKYIADNPRRLAIKRLYPDFFRRLISVRIGERCFNCYGNPFLLQCPDKMAIKVRSRWSDQEFEEHRRRWMAYCERGAIAVSPFISAREKRIRDEVIDMGGSLIVIRKENFPARFKPSGREFELCSEGRLLLICDPAALDHDRSLFREEALRMNSFAEMIAGIASESIVFSICHSENF